MWNRQAGSGSTARLEVVPFPNGDDPTAPPVRILISLSIEFLLKTFSQHNLTRLDTPSRVRNLNAPTRDAYFQGYFPGVPLPAPPGERPALILKAIGVS